MPAPTMNTDSRRKASADFHAKRKAEGWRKVTVWLSPEAVAKVDALKKAAGSADDVHRQAILAWPGPGAPPMVPQVKPKVAPKAEKPAAKSPAAELPFGPVRAKPGSRLIDKRKGRR